MKTLLSLTLLISVYNALIGQSDFIFTEDWPINSSLIIDLATITRLEGENGIRGITNIGYESPAILKLKLKEDAEEELWSDEKKQEEIEFLNSVQKGGRITLFLKRHSIAAANTKFFSLIIHDMDGNEILREDLSERIAEVPVKDKLWFNVALKNIEKEMPKKFIVYVIDKLGGDNKRFKFEVSAL